MSDRICIFDPWEDGKYALETLIPLYTKPDSAYPIEPEMQCLFRELVAQTRAALVKMPRGRDCTYDDADAPWNTKKDAPGWAFERAVDEWHVEKLAPALDAESARWLRLSRYVYFCANDFERATWLPMVARDLSLVRWMVDSAYWVESRSGVATSESLRECMPRLVEARPSAAEELRRLLESLGPAAAGARVLLSVQKGAGIVEAWWSQFGGTSA